MSALPRRVHVWAPGMFGFTGGIQSYLRDLVRALRVEIPDAAITAFVKNDTTGPGSRPGFDRVTFRWTGDVQGALRTPRFLAAVLAGAIAEPPELIVVGHANFAPAAMALHRLLGVPYWVVAYGLEVWDDQPAVRRRALRDAERVLAISAHTRERLLNEHQLEPARVVLQPPTFDEEVCRPGPKPAHLLARYDLTPEQPVLLTVGRLAGGDRFKGYDQVLAAMPRVLAAHPRARYLIAGTGDDRPRIEALIARLELGGAVTLTGYVPDDELRDHYNLCDVFAMPSKREGFGIVFVEAMACGKPALGGDRDGAVDALGRGTLGVLVDPDDVPGIARQLVALLARQYPVPLMADPVDLREAVVASFGEAAFRGRLAAHLLGRRTDARR